MILLLVLTLSLYASSCDNILLDIQDRLLVVTKVSDQNRIVDELVEIYNELAVNKRDDLMVRRLGRQVMSIQRRPKNELESKQRVNIIKKFIKGIKEIGNETD